MKPILFNTEMVRAILEGRKTVNRRVVRGAWPDWNYLGLTDDAAVTAVDRYGEEYTKPVDGLWAEFEDADGPVECPMIKSPYRPGDILYVRETWNFGYIETPDVERSYDAWFEEWDWRTREQHSYLNVFSRFWYRADEDDVGNVCIPWRSSVHMPKEAARLFLRVKDVRVERLQDCGNAQAKDEGCTCCSQFARLWDSTIKPTARGRYGWVANPWVWVIEFERCEKLERGRE